MARKPTQGQIDRLDQLITATRNDPEILRHSLRHVLGYRETPSRWRELDRLLTEVVYAVGPNYLVPFNNKSIAASERSR